MIWKAYFKVTSVFEFEGAELIGYNRLLLLKFIYSEKATEFCEISPLLLTVCTAVKSKVKISQNFVAFSEYMNFKSIFELKIKKMCQIQKKKIAPCLNPHPLVIIPPAPPPLGNTSFISLNLTLFFIFNLKILLI